MKQVILQLIWSAHQAKRYFRYMFAKANNNSIEVIKEKAAGGKLLDDLDAEEKKSWENRISMAMVSTDNQYIPRHKDAGTIQGKHLIMHNGIKVDPLSYYGFPPLKLLIDNKGVHEPQEERVFQEVIKTIKPGGVMMELGSYWSFYSMWFYSVVKNAKCYMVEPELPNIKFGKRNFRDNGMNGVFYQAFLGDRTFVTHQGDRFVTVDDFRKKNKIDFIDLLHSDIQGNEFKMLQGAKETFAQKKVGYVFISTHANSIHAQCLEFLKEHGFVIIANADLDDTFSVDGLIVGRAPWYPGMDALEISKRGGKLEVRA